MMELTDLRAQIDVIDRELVALLERRIDVAAGVAEYKMAHGLPVLDQGREAVKMAAIKAMCAPEKAASVAGVFDAILAASRAWQTALMEDGHGA